MVVNLPDRIDALKLEKFNFGSIEASTDSLLETCFCRTEPVSEFLNDRYNVLLGAKGVGKSSVFSLLSSKRLLFANRQKDTCDILALDEEMEYESLRALIQQGLASSIEHAGQRAFFLWEAYILFRLASEFVNRADIPEDFRGPLKDFTEALRGTPEKPTLYKIMSAFMPTITFKLDATNPSLITPGFSITPPADAPEPKSRRPSVKTIDLQDIKRKINRMANRQGRHIYVLIDHLDDFVAQEDYHTQKQLLEGILRCCKDYDRHDHLHLRIFLRSDLYERLDFSQIGGRAKTDQRCVQLIWSSENIRQFIAERLLYNLSETYGIDRLTVAIEQDSLLLRHQSSKAPKRGWLAKLFQDQPAPSDLYDERFLHLRDKAYRVLISAFFPNAVPHFGEGGTEDEADIFDYFQEHFQLANGECTPRHILLYLQNIRRVAFQYYTANPDQANLTLGNGYFKLFHPRHMLQAYYTLQSGMCNIFKGCITHIPWQRKLEIFFHNKKKSNRFSTTRLRKMLKFETTSELYDFLACMEHLRILTRTDPMAAPEQRVYELPVLLRQIYSPSKYTKEIGRNMLRGKD